MSHFSNRLATWGKHALKSVGLASVLAAGVLTATVTANGPEFNNLPQDYPTLQVQKVGDTTWSQTQTAVPGEYLNMIIWVHNTQVGTTAQNVRAKLELPATYQTAQAPKATIWAENAAAIVGSVQITSNSAVRLVYQVGSARLKQNLNGQMTFVNWPAGVNPDQVVEPEGVSLGNMNGCWTYAQAVEVQVRVEAGNPQIATTKQVSLDQSSYQTQVVATPDQVVHYKVTLANPGNSLGLNPIITDLIEAKTDYIPGTSTVQIGQQSPVSISESTINKEVFRDATTRLTWHFSDLAPAANASITLRFQVKVRPVADFPVGLTQIYNTASAAFTNVTAVNTNTTEVDVTRAPDRVITFDLVKEVSNLTSGQSTWSAGEPAIVANPGDLISFRLIVTDTGNSNASNVSVKDLLPAQLTYQAGSSKLYPENLTLPDSWINTSYTLPEMASGTRNQKIIVFNAKVTDSCTGQTTITNRGQVWYGGAMQAGDTASVAINCRPGLVLTKEIRNLQTGLFQTNIGEVHEGATLTYRINLSNTGNLNLSSNWVKDVLPGNVTYIQDSLSLDGTFQSSSAQADFLSNGLGLGTLTVGASKTLIFQVKVDQCPPLGSFDLINTAYAAGSGLSQLSAQALAHVTVSKPGL